MQQYLFKLIPPRSTFPGDMSAEEAALMKAHGSYWNNLLENNIAIVFGPVLDKTGAWGLGILDVENEAQAIEIAKDDPTVKAGLNTFEIIPIKAVFKRK